MLHPMENFSTPEEVYQFPLPDMLEDYRWEGLEEEVKKIHADGYAAIFTSIMVFEYHLVFTRDGKSAVRHDK